MLVASAPWAHALAAGLLASVLVTEATAVGLEELEIEALVEAMGNKRQYHPLHRDVVAKRPPGEHELQDCKEGPTEALVAVARHGQRFPSRSKLNKYIRPFIAESSGSPDALLSAWAKEAQADRCFSDATAELLHPVGTEELRQLGRELTKWVIEASGAVSQANVQLASSPVQRCRDSCAALSEGIHQNAEERGVNVSFRHSTAEFLSYHAHEKCHRYVEKHDDYKQLRWSFLQQNDLAESLRYYYTCQAYYSCYGANASAAYLPCRLLADRFTDFARVDDLTNFFMRGPASRLHDGSDNVAMWLGLPVVRQLETALASGGTHIFCTHDSVLFPIVTLLDLFDLGRAPEHSNASRIMPMASRLVLRRVASGRICAHYNGRLVASAMGVSDWWGHASTRVDRCVSEEL